MLYLLRRWLLQPALARWRTTRRRLIPPWEAPLSRGFQGFLYVGEAGERDMEYGVEALNLMLGAHLTRRWKASPLP